MSITDHISHIQRVRNSSNARRRRGYNWEDTLVKRINIVNGWSGFRLGSASVSLPDVLGLNPATKSAFVIEAKSGTADRLIVPAHQIERCIDWCHVLAPFKNRRVILAFKFLSKKRIGVGQYDGRQLREFFKEWNPRIQPIECICMYDGQTYGRYNNKRVSLKLEDCVLPAQKKHRGSQDI